VLTKPMTCGSAKFSEKALLFVRLASWSSSITHFTRTGV